MDPYARSHDGELIMQVGLMDAENTDVAACRNEAIINTHDCNQYLNIGYITAHLQEHATNKTTYDMHDINTAEFNHKPPTQFLDNLCHGEGSMLFV